MESKVKKRLIGLARWGVTLAAVIWVLLKIEWLDQLKTDTGELLRGRISVETDRFVVRTSTSQVRDVPRELANEEDAFQPGFLTLFRQIRPVYLLLGLIVYPLANVLGAVRWRVLMRAHDMDPGLKRSMQLTWLGFFWSLVLPGVTGGDVVKAYCVARTVQKQTVAVLIVLLDRVIGLVGLALLSGLVILFNLHNAELRTVSSGILVFIVVMVGGGLLFFSRRLRRWFGLEFLMRRLPFQARVAQMDEALFHYRYHKWAMVSAVLLSLGTHVANVGTFCLVGQALGLPVAWQHYFVFIPVVLMIAALPISVGGLGVFESGVAHFLTLRGVGATASGALALCVVFRILTIFVGLPGAMVRVQEDRGQGLEVTAQRGELEAQGSGEHKSTR